MKNERRGEDIARHFQRTIGEKRSCNLRTPFSFLFCDTMTVTSINIPDQQREEYEEKLEFLKQTLGVQSTSQVIVELVLRFPRLYFESQMYRGFYRDFMAYEALYEKTTGKRGANDKINII